MLSHESLDALITTIDNHTSKLVALAKRQAKIAGIKQDVDKTQAICNQLSTRLRKFKTEKIDLEVSIKAL